MHDWKNKNHTIKTIQNTAMPGNKISRILNGETAFNRTLDKVTKLRKNTEDSNQYQ